MPTTIDCTSRITWHGAPGRPTAFHGLKGIGLILVLFMGSLHATHTLAKERPNSRLGHHGIIKWKESTAQGASSQGTTQVSCPGCALQSLGAAFGFVNINPSNQTKVQANTINTHQYNDASSIGINLR
jgi:hypothetical protein